MISLLTCPSGTSTTASEIGIRAEDDLIVISLLACVAHSNIHPASQPATASQVYLHRYLSPRSQFSSDIGKQQILDHSERSSVRALAEMERGFRARQKD